MIDRQLLEPCLEWKGATGLDGYPYPSKGVNMHRAVYVKAFGPQPELEVHHICENRRCLNLEHLVAMTKYDHMNTYRWGVRKSNICNRGHDKNTVGYRTDGSCRECFNIWQRRRRSREEA